MWKVYYKGKTDKYYILVLKLFFMNEETFVIISARHRSAISKTSVGIFNILVTGLINNFLLDDVFSKDGNFIIFIVAPSIKPDYYYEK